VEQVQPANGAVHQGPDNRLGGAPSANSSRKHWTTTVVCSSLIAQPIGRGVVTPPPIV